MELLDHMVVLFLVLKEPVYWGFPGGASGKEPTCQCRRCKRCRFNSCLGKIPWRGHSNLIQYSRLENPMDRGVWRAAVYRVAELDKTEATQHTQHILFSIMVVSIDAPTNSVKGFPFLHTLSSIYYF